MNTGRYVQYILSDQSDPFMMPGLCPLLEGEIYRKTLPILGQKKRFFRSHRRLVKLLVHILSAIVDIGLARGG